MTHLTQSQLEKLQQLSNIELNSSEQEDFLQKLDPVIAKLEELGKYPTSLSSEEREVKSEVKTETSEVSLRTLDTTFEWEKQKNIAENIIKNVEHEIINNSIVIKSVLS